MTLIDAWATSLVTSEGTLDQDVMPDKAGQALNVILAHLSDKEQNIPTHPLFAPPTKALPGTWPLFAGIESTTTTLN